MLNTTLLAPSEHGRHRTYPIGETLRVLTPDGRGTVKYFVSDGFAGVQLDGERRVDEYALAQLGNAAAPAPPATLTYAQLESVVRETVAQQVATTRSGCKLSAVDAKAVEDLARNIVGNVVMALAGELGVES